MFDKCIYKYDRELYEELYQGDFRNEVQQNHEIMIAELKSIKGIVQIYRLRNRTKPFH